MSFTRCSFDSWRCYSGLVHSTSERLSAVDRGLAGDEQEGDSPQRHFFGAVRKKLLDGMSVFD